MKKKLTSRHQQQESKDHMSLSQHFIDSFAPSNGASAGQEYGRSRADAGGMAFQPHMNNYFGQAQQFQTQSLRKKMAPGSSTFQNDLIQISSFSPQEFHPAARGNTALRGGKNDKPRGKGGEAGSYVAQGQTGLRNFKQLNPSQQKGKKKIVDLSSKYADNPLLSTASLKVEQPIFQMPSSQHSTEAPFIDSDRSQQEGTPSKGAVPSGGSSQQWRSELLKFTEDPSFHSKFKSVHHIPSFVPKPPQQHGNPVQKQAQNQQPSYTQLRAKNLMPWPTTEVKMEESAEKVSLAETDSACSDEPGKIAAMIGSTPTKIEQDQQSYQWLRCMGSSPMKGESPNKSPLQPAFGSHTPLRFKAKGVTATSDANGPSPIKMDSKLADHQFGMRVDNMSQMQSEFIETPDAVTVSSCQISDMNTLTDDSFISSSKLSNARRRKNKKKRKNEDLALSKVAHIINQTNQSMSIQQGPNHEVSTNCLRKCARWTLDVQSRVGGKALAHIAFPQNSGIALRQMNYQVLKNLTKEEAMLQKKMFPVPSGPAPIEQDLIDNLIEYENLFIFNDLRDFHEESCAMKSQGPDIGAVPLDGVAQCCEVKIKKVNKYNQHSYLNQPLELPLDLEDTEAKIEQLAQSQNHAQSQNLKPQIMSSSSSSHTSGLLPYSEGPNPLTYVPGQEGEVPVPSLRDQMLSFHRQGQAENLFCLEFNFEDVFVPLEEVKDDEDPRDPFRFITQTFIETTFNFRIQGECHESKIFGPSEQALSFSVSGKKIIKSIQDRFLSLKQQLIDIVKSSPKIQVPDFMNGESEQKMNRFYLNRIETLNKMGFGPWLTKSKQTMIVKLVNFSGKSVAIQVRAPGLRELQNQMTNFNQLVLQKFEILKVMICFDLPLSRLNRCQVETINDLENYLTVKSLQTSLSKLQDLTPQMKEASAGETVVGSSTSNGTPSVLNLLSEFKALQQTSKPIPQFVPEGRPRKDESESKQQVNHAIFSQVHPQELENLAQFNEDDQSGKTLTMPSSSSMLSPVVGPNSTTEQSVLNYNLEAHLQNSMKKGIQESDPDLSQLYMVKPGIEITGNNHPVHYFQDVQKLPTETNTKMLAHFAKSQAQVPSAQAQTTQHPHADFIAWDQPFPAEASLRLESPEDQCNFDKVLRALNIDHFCTETQSLSDLVKSLRSASTFGSKVHCTDNMNPSINHVLTFIPQLQGLFIAPLDAGRLRVPPYFTMPKSGYNQTGKTLFTQMRELTMAEDPEFFMSGGDLDSSSSSSSWSNENAPKPKPDAMINKHDIENSWFLIEWRYHSCEIFQSKHADEKEKSMLEMMQDRGSEDFDLLMAFTVLYKFTSKQNRQNKGPALTIRGVNSDIEIVGVSSKNINEDYWTLPRQLGMQNSAEGMIYDQMKQNNLYKMFTLASNLRTSLFQDAVHMPQGEVSSTMTEFLKSS